MRCKPGDLAIQISGVNAGVLMDVLKPHDYHLNAWDVRVHSEAVNNFGMVVKKGEITGALDSRLWPIRDPGDLAIDETLLRLPAPSREKETA